MKFSGRNKRHSEKSQRTQRTQKSSSTITTQQGTVKRHPDGFGFFIPDNPESPDVYIPRQSMEGIMTHDKVMVNVTREQRGDRFRGEITKIISRGHKRIVGQFYPYNGGGGLIRDEGKGWGGDLVIKSNDTMGAKQGELVAAEITTYPSEGTFAGKVVEVIGDVEDPMTDIRRVLLTQNIPHEWSPAVEKEAKQFSETVSESDMKGRTDLRKLNLITIDGATAKDFDDAIYVEKNGQGFRLIVAIADVSHYVRLGTAIDGEAYTRGTSVYFPNFVTPMLPEVLSNGLCSLNPHVNRLALVSETQIDRNGTHLSSKFYEAVIESKARVTYGEAQEIIDGGTIQKLNHVRDDILVAEELAKILMKRRFADGSLELEIPEISLVIDAAGNPVDILRSERLFAHRLIEEMMLTANVAVATFLTERKIPAIYRIHEPPPADALTTLERFLKSFGSNTRLSGGKLQMNLTKALQEFSGTPRAQVLNILTLRSMAQAKYSPNNLGHFGLGFENYTHFTSPIRRYPDLIVHRLLKSQIGIKNYKAMSEGELATAGTMLSACEQRSVKAERQIQAIKKARFMVKFVGQEFEGLISSVTKFGAFVLLRQFEIDGLVSLANLGETDRDNLVFDEKNLRLVAKRSGRSFEIGQVIKVRVAKADPELGQVDFELADGKQRQASDVKEKPHRFDQARKQGRGHGIQSRFKPQKGQPRRKQEPREERFAKAAPKPEAPATTGAAKFDVDKKLEEFFLKRGLKPTGAMNEDRPRKLGFGNPDEAKQKRDKRNERRDKSNDRRNDKNGKSDKGGDRRQGKKHR